MAVWLAKSAVQGVISLLPGSEALNAFLQRHVTRSTTNQLGRLDERMGVVRQHHLANLERFGERGIDGATVVELGTGWHPVVPVSLWLAGAGEVHTFDLVSLLRDENVQGTIDTIVQAVHRDPATFDWVIPDRLAQLEQVAAQRSGVASLEALGVHTHVGDARHTGLPHGSVDLVVSNNVLEHVGRPVIPDLYVEFARICRPGGILSQRIDMRDHFARVDKRIGPFNYLKYSHRAWRWLGSRLEHQNRLRHPEHVRLLTENGWSVVHEDTTDAPLDGLRRVKVHPDFAHLTEDELRVLDTWQVARPTPVS